MRRSAWIFLAAIFLPSLGLAWLAVHSVRDQQVVLEHQQAIISQNITDALAKSVQGRMDQARGDFVQTTQQLLGGSESPQALAKNFNRKLRDAWPMAEIGFAVDLDGEIYSPQAYDGPGAKTFRDENDRFLSNRENVVVYSSNSAVLNQYNIAGQANATKFAFKQTDQLAATSADKEETQALKTAGAARASRKKAPLPGSAKDEDLSAGAARSATEAKPEGGADLAKAGSSATGQAMQAPESDQNAPASSVATVAPAAPSADAAATPPMFQERDSVVVSLPVAPASAGATPPSQEPTTMSVPTELVPSTASSSPGGLGNAAPSFAKIQRQVIPQQNAAQAVAPLSNTVPEESDFRRVIGAETSGALARFLENKLRLMVWSHPSADTPIVFGAQLDPGRLVEALKASFQIPELAQDGSSRPGGGDYCAAILDDTGRPVALSRPGFTGDWKHPFVATEIGEALPHWEAALYLVDPQQISRAAP